MLLYFEPSITVIKWPQVIEALKVLHPKLTWASRVNLDSFNPFEAFDPLSQSVMSLPPINGLVIDFYNKLSYGRFQNLESMLKLTGGYGTKVVDGWEYLGMRQDTDSIFDSLDGTMNINESDDFEWAEEIIKDTLDVVDYRTVKQGDKVVPGKDWMFGNQAQNSVYGIVDMEEYGGEPMFIEDSTDEEFWQYWVHVDWIGKGGSVMFRNNYRVGPDYHDLKYYVPKPTKRKKGIKESEENIQEITHNDLQVGMTVIVDGYDVVEETQKWENEIGTVVYNYNEDELETGNSFTISFKNWAKGHDGSSNLAAECGHNKCWSFYDDCAHWNLPRYDGACQNIDGIKFYTVNTYDLFDQLNESEEDGFEWAKESISQEYHKYGNILPYLENDDIISVTGDFNSDEGEVLLSVEDEPFKVFSYPNKTVYLKWVKPEEERPKHWKAITDGSENVHMGDNTFDWDKELVVKVVSRENYPF